MPNNNDRGNSHEENSLSDQGPSAGTIGAIFDNGVERKDQAAGKTTEAADKVAEIRKIPDIVKRARRLFEAQQIQFKDVKKVRSGDAFITQPLPTDTNKFIVLNSMFEGEDDMPHHDLFRGRIVDHEGIIIDDHYPVVHWVEAFDAAQLRGVPAKTARESIKEWALARKRNDLINYVETKLPEWDKTPRLETKLIEMFDCRENDLNKLVSKYFWLSLYSRVMIPGSLAPIVLSLFGAQGCGKSRFTKRLAQIITGNEETDTLQRQYPVHTRRHLVEPQAEITHQDATKAAGAYTNDPRESTK